MIIKQVPVFVQMVASVAAALIFQTRCSQATVGHVLLPDCGETKPEGQTPSYFFVATTEAVSL